jgi:hypothetical protein
MPAGAGAAGIPMIGLRMLWLLDRRDFLGLEFLML